MVGTRKVRVLMAEQIRLIMEKALYPILLLCIPWRLRLHG